MDFSDLETTLSKHNQSHLLQFWDQLSKEERKCLLEDLASVDFAQVNENFRKVNQNTSSSSSSSATNDDDEENFDASLEPVPSDCFGSFSRSDETTLRSYEDAGLKAVAQGRVGVLLLAGGQGTRLGVSYPKGMYDVGLPSKKSLYQLQAERIIKLEELATARYASDAAESRRRRRRSTSGGGGTSGGLLPWYIMTSEATRDQTLEFFRRHAFFGLKEDDVVVFEQNRIPCLTNDGKIMLEEKHRIARSPDGNGGLYSALDQCGILDDMRERGVGCVHVYCVDNILVKMADPVFVGYCLKQGAECGAKVVEKSHPQEAVGVVCKVKGAFQVVEYSEISSATAERRDPDGRLTFNAGNICNHFFTTAFLRDVVAKHEKKLQHHVAHKKIPYVDSDAEAPRVALKPSRFPITDGIKVKPTKNNGIKLEKFVFDVFPFSKNFACWEVLREDEFSPLKNGEGAARDSPSTARSALVSLHLRQMLGAGATFRDSQGRHFGDSTSTSTSDHAPICEISPLLSYAGEGLEALVKGRCFASPLHLQPNNNEEDS